MPPKRRFHIGDDLNSDVLVQNLNGISGRSRSNPQLTLANRDWLPDHFFLIGSLEKRSDGGPTPSYLVMSKPSEEIWAIDIVNVDMVALQNYDHIGTGKYLIAESFLGFLKLLE